MWLIAGVLLGLVILFSLLGFHTGPHSQVAAGGIGVVAALWLVIMAATGGSSSILWSLLSADLVVSGGIGVVAWRALKDPGTAAHGQHTASLEGKIGRAVTPLSPEGIVRVNGENWSATSLNGPHGEGSSIQVVSVSGVRLEVWGDTAPLEGSATNEILPSTSQERKTGTQ